MSDRAGQQTTLPPDRTRGAPRRDIAIIAGSLVAAFSAADPGIGKDRNHIPTVPLGDGLKLLLLVFDGLFCCRHSQVKSDAL
jgi:hypothetical protein